uniref:EF-hand domain-containing protein n=1 Tax=Panagrolaimus sp. PS1159 TaxID=55785 RepID=A0AC35GQ71_9BILA
MILIIACVFILSFSIGNGQIPDRLNWEDFQKYQICNRVIIKECFKDMDANGDNIVTAQEMREYWDKNNERIAKMDEARYETEFKNADKNHDGILSAVEVQQFLDETYNRTPAFNNFFKSQVDKNGDGQLNKDEFIYLRKHGDEIPL